jgi:hypothetical protein
LETKEARRTNVPDLVLGADGTGHADDVVGVGDVVPDRFLVVAVFLDGSMRIVNRVVKEREYICSQ